MSVPVNVKQRVRGAQHIESWVQPWTGSHMLWFNCHVCGDLTQRPCSNPTMRWGYWAQTYAKMHPATPHAR